MDAISIVSYNISFAEPSSSAADSVLRARQAPRLLRDKILRSSPARPDVIALQECPRESWGAALFGPDYVSMGTRPASHVPEGHVDLLVRRELASGAKRIDLDHPTFVLPSVATAIAPSNGTPIAVCSVHLPHAAEGAPMREMMCEATMEIISRKFSNCILIGDFNMRDKEDEVVENLDGGGWIDAWKRAGGQNKESKVTWDSRENHFHENGYAFACRSDRCLVRGAALAPARFDLIGNRPDYGIAVKVDVLRLPSRPGNCSNQALIKSRGLVDLTGDGDDDDDIAFSSSRKGGDEKSANVDDVAKQNDGQICLEAMRCLRLQKFSGSAGKSIGKKSTSKVNKSGRPSTNTLSSGIVFDCSEGQRHGMSDDNESISADGSLRYIQPVEPKKFTVVESIAPKRYIIYMAIRERKDSRFERGLAKCHNTCHEGVRHCLQMDGTRHITMFDGKLTAHQVESLAFGGHFSPIKIEIDGWKRWDAGCYLKLNESSELALRDLLSRIVGLPPVGGTRPCDHISLYRKRANTHFSDLKREFRKIREATKFHHWGCVEGVGVRIKPFGGPYCECRVLLEGRPGSRNDKIPKNGLPVGWNNLRDTGLDPKHPLRDDQWNNGYDSNAGHRSAPHQRARSRDCPINGDLGSTHKRVTFRHYPTSDSNMNLNILSWNISETAMSAVSAAAPDPCLRARESARLIREECLRPHLESQRQNGNAFLPDIIALQETPDEGWGSAVFGPSGYVSVGTQHSHCGLVDLLVRKDFAAQRICSAGGYCKVEKREQSLFGGDCQSELPFVCAILTMPNRTLVGVASCHLSPHASGASARAHESKLLMELVMKKCQNAILIGDMNMRKAEDKVIESFGGGGGWLDAWKGSGSRKQMCFTWNSFENRYHENGFKFKCRFDRCYVWGENFSVEQFALFGNRPASGTEGDHLSDHFGIAVALTTDKKKTIAAVKCDTNIMGGRNLLCSSGINLSCSDRHLSEMSTSQKLSKVQNDSKGEWDTNSIVKGSKETPIRGNGKMSARSTKSKSTTSKVTNQPISNGLDPFAGKKTTKMPKPAKKRRRFDSSSSDDDDEEFFCLLAQKQGRTYEPREGRVAAASNHTAPTITSRKKGRFESSSSDDDEEILHMLARRRCQEGKMKKIFS